MTFTEKQVEGFTVVAIEEKLDAVMAERIQTQLEMILKSSSKGVILDLKNLTYLSSAGMRVFLQLAKEAKMVKKQVGFATLSTTVKETLDITGFSSYLNIYADVQAAIHGLDQSFWAGVEL